MKSDIKRGIPQDMLEKYSKRIVFASQVLASKYLTPFGKFPRNA